MEILLYSDMRNHNSLDDMSNEPVVVELLLVRMCLVWHETGVSGHVCVGLGKESSLCWEVYLRVSVGISR